MLVMPAEMGSMIERCATDPISRSLRWTDPTSASLRETDLTTRPLDLAEACFPVSVGIGLRVLREGGTLFAV